jgi:hypothetical protein
VRGVTRCVAVTLLLLLLIGIGSSQSSKSFAPLGAASVYAKDPNFVLGAAASAAYAAVLQEPCAGALLDVYHIYSTTVGVAVSTVTFSTQRYAFGCAQLDAVTVATTSTVTQATTTTETQTVTTGTTVTQTETRTVTTGTTTTQTQTVTETQTVTTGATVTTVVSETVTLTTITTTFATTTVETTTTSTTTQTITQTQATTQTVTTGTTATVTQTKTTVSSTTTVLQVRVQEGVYALLALLLGSMAPLLTRAALKAERICRERRALRAVEGPSGGPMQGLDAEPYRKKRRALR